MSEFLDAAFTMPTAVFSVLLGLAALYWLTVFVGFLDLGILDAVFDLFEGATEGGAEALEGAIDGAAEGLDAGDRAGCLSLFGGVPVTITGTLLALFAWTFSYAGSELVAGVLGAGALAATVVGVAAFALSTAITSVAVRPLRKLFKAPKVTSRRDLVGRVCTVTTLKVDERFGQAEVGDGGSAILIQARSKGPAGLTRGSQALVYEYDPTNEVFYVTALPEALEK